MAKLLENRHSGANKNVSRKRNVANTIWLIVLLTACFIYAGILMLQSPNSPFSKIVEYTDSGVFQYIGKGILDGIMPYRDAFDHKGPVLYLLNALGFFIAGREGIWMIEWLILFATMAVSYKLCRVYFTPAASVLAVASTYSLMALYLKGGNFTEEYAMLPCVIALYIFALYFKYKKVSNLQLFVLGAGCMSVLLLKANVASAWVIFCIYFAGEAIWKKEWKELLRYVLFFLAGALAFLLPIAVWLAANGAWDDCITAYLKFNMTYTEAKGSMAMLESAKFFLDDQMQLQLLLGILAPIFVYIKGRDKGKSTFVLLNTIYFLFAFFFMIMPGNQYIHYGLYYMPAMLVIYGVLFYYLERWIRTNQEVLVCIAVCVLLFCVKKFWLSNMLVQIDEIAATQQASEEHQMVLDAVERWTEPDDQLMVIGAECWIYNHSGRQAANKYIFQLPLTIISPEIKEEFFALVAEDLPDMVITRNYGIEEERICEEHGYVLKETCGTYFLYIHE